MTQTMNQMREALVGNTTMTVNHLIQKINKKGIVNLDKADLLEVIKYYERLNVLYMDPEERVMFL